MVIESKFGVTLKFIGFKRVFPVNRFIDFIEIFLLRLFKPWIMGTVWDYGYRVC